MKQVSRIITWFLIGFGLAMGYNKLAYPKAVKAQYSTQCSAFGSTFSDCGDNVSCGLGQYTVSGAYETGGGTMATVLASVPCEGTTCSNVLDVPTATSNSAYCCDRDSDTYGGNHPSCPTATDCDDGDANRHPGATELCDGIDNNCNGFLDDGYDSDGDGYRLCDNDCDDYDYRVNPGQSEICGDGLDNDCFDGDASCPQECNEDDHWICNQIHGTWYGWPDCYCNDGSPILVDVSGNGFSLTDASGGVDFDLNAVGTKERLGWTTPGSDDAWLALDRNGNGKIDDGTELFGNYTDQPAPPPGTSRNGFLALAEFDKTGNGGNGDVRISAEDSIYASLRLWRDSNHNGVSESSELYTLSQLGLSAIDLDFHISRKRDKNGNLFRYRAKVYGTDGAQLGRWAWDVYLTHN